jgi:hypothetical protein
METVFDFGFAREILTHEKLQSHLHTTNYAGGPPEGARHRECRRVVRQRRSGFVKAAVEIEYRQSVFRALHDGNRELKTSARDRRWSGALGRECEVRRMQWHFTSEKS